MTKKRNKNKQSDSMEITSETVINVPQAMDTSESAAAVEASTVAIRKTKRGLHMRKQHVRKLKAVARAIAKNEKKDTKATKKESKKLITLSAKKLYD